MRSSIEHMPFFAAQKKRIAALRLGPCHGLANHLIHQECCCVCRNTSAESWGKAFEERGHAICCIQLHKHRCHTHSSCIAHACQNMCNIVQRFCSVQQAVCVI